jgi:hypothetical protein
MWKTVRASSRTTRINESPAVVSRVPCVSIAEPLVVGRAERVERRRLVVDGRSACEVGRVRAVVAGAYRVMAAAPHVHNEGRKVAPRRSERRPRVPSVGTGARGVVARIRRVPRDVQCVSHRVSTVASNGLNRAREGRHVSSRAGVVVARSRSVSP